MRTDSPFSTLINRQLNKSKTPYSTMPQGFYGYNMNDLNYLDPDTLRDQLIKIKSEFNKKNQDYHKLKIAYNKLSKDNKKSLKIIGDLISEANKNLVRQGEEPIDEENDPQEEVIAKVASNVPHESKEKSFNYYMDERVKEEFRKMQEELRKKDTIITSLSKNAKSQQRRFVEIRKFETI